MADGTVKCIDDEIPFEIPQSWCWVRMRHILNIGSARRVHEKDWRSSGIPFYRAREIGKLAEYGHVDNDLFIDQELYDEFSQSGVPLSGDLMVTAVGTLGKVYVVHDNEVFYYKDGSVLCLGNTFNLNSNFLKLAIESPFFITQYQNESQGTTVATLTMVRMNEYLLPIPPIAEQQRVVSMIEDIMPSINRYEKSQEALDKLNAEIFEKLKKSVLQEAIQGKLVPQDPNDEPASILLERIKAEKARLFKDGKLKKKDITNSVIFKGEDNKYYEQIGKEVLDISEDIPFESPESWSWTRLSNICSICTGATFKKEDATQNQSGVRILRGGNILPFRIFIKDDDIFIPRNAVKDNILLRQNDIVTPAVTSLENIGKMARIESDMPTATVGGFVFILRPYLNDAILSEYLLSAMSAPATVEFIRSITNKSGQAFYNIGKERLSTTLIPVPPHGEQRHITRHIQHLFSKLR